MSKIHLTMGEVRKIVTESVRRIVNENEENAAHEKMPDEIFDDLKEALKYHTLWLENDFGDFTTEGLWGDKYGFEIDGDYECKTEYIPAEFNWGSGFGVSGLWVNVSPIVAVYDDDENCTVYELTDSQREYVENTIEEKWEFSKDYERELYNRLDDDF